MSKHGEEIAASWQDEEFARAWVAADGQETLLALPRAMAAAIVADDRPDVHVVIDVASGPGSFLAAFLQEFPAARGVWTDASQAMLDTARVRLAEFGDRVSFVLAEMTELAGASLPPAADVVLTSRASHHLDREGLVAFYRSAAELLAPGGWLINLDHVRLSAPWNERMRSARRRFVPGRQTAGQSHYRVGDSPTATDHLDGYVACGIADPEICWRAFRTCLFMGQVSSGA